MNGLKTKRVVQRLALVFVVLGIAALSFVLTPAPARRPPRLRPPGKSSQTA